MATEECSQACGALERHVLSWVTTSPRRLELCAAIKDFQGIVDAAPQNPANLAHIGQGRLRRLLPLANIVTSLKGMLVQKLLPHMRAAVRKVIPVVSPFLGGISDAPAAKHSKHECFSLKVATLNPGRTGFLALATEEIMWWRVWHVTSALISRDIQICVLPGARWPPGASLPPGLPFIWLGTQTSSWRAVGMLVSTEIVSQVQVIDDLGSDVILWVWVGNKERGALSQIIIGGIYPRPGGDVETWTQILTEFAVLKSRFPGIKIFIVGDANLHLSYLVQHEGRRCSCLHCAQKRNDAKIEADLQQADVFAFNPPVPTHSSGSIIDLVLSDAGSPLNVFVDSESIGLSDHKLVWADCSVQLQFSFTCSVGRVLWAKPSLWEDVFTQALPVLQVLRRATEEATEEILEARSLQVKRRRAIVDAAAWARDAVVCLLGHSSELTSARVASSGQVDRGGPVWPKSVPRPEEFDDYEAYKSAMADFNAGIREGVYNKFAALRSCDPNEAKRFLSTCFKGKQNFQVALTDEETGQLLSTQQALQALVEDLEARADVHAEQVSAESCWVSEAVQGVRRAKAPASGLPGLPPLPQLTTASNPNLYSSAEFEQAVSSMQVRKQCIHGPLAAIKANVPEARELTLALVNLARAAEVTATSWCFRRITPLRKQGPRVVRKLKCLRPISLATDMASVQDALWLARCKQQLETYTDHRQVGGKLDTILVILAVMLHVQIRHYQGLDTFLLFSDIQHAFDTASHDGMLLAAFLSGVVEVEWRLLDDFLKMDSASIMLGGVLSRALSLGVGIPQGKKFSVHVFSALLKHFGDILLSECAPANTVLPSFAADAISGLWASLTPAPSCMRQLRLGEQPSLQQMAAAIRQAPSITEARRVAIHLLAGIQERQKRAQCVELLGALPLGPLLFVDDVVTSFATDADIQHAVTYGLPSYARFAKAQFNLGPTKTAVMSCMDAAKSCLVHMSCDSYKLLGVLVDSQFSFSARSKQIIQIGKAMFDELSHLITELGLPPPVHAAAIVERVEPVVLYAAELLAMTPEVLPKLDLLQGEWAKGVLAGRAGSVLRGSLAVALLGWQLRLSSKALLRMFLCLAKIQRLPVDHPAALMLAVAKSLPSDTWWHAVESLRHQLREDSAAGTFPDILAANLCTQEMLVRAKQDSAVRKNLLLLYKTRILLPILCARDEAEFQKAASKHLVGMGLAFADLGCVRRQCDWSHLLPILTGMWPLSLLSELPPEVELDKCPFCDRCSVWIRHALCECPGTADLFVASGLALHASRGVEANLLMQMLFHSATEDAIDAARIRYVGRALAGSIEAYVRQKNWCVATTC